MEIKHSARSADLPPPLEAKPRNSLRHAVDPERYEMLVAVINREIDAQRAVDLATPEGSEPVIFGLLETVGVPRANLKGAHDYLTNFDLLGRCSKELGITIAELLNQVLDAFRLPNWESLFYMKAWIEEVDKRFASELAILNLSRERDRIAAQQRAQASAGGKAKDRILHDKPRTFVQEEWKRHGVPVYAGNKSHFARIYSKRVWHEFNCVVTERTIANSWLKGQ